MTKKTRNRLIALALSAVASLILAEIALRVGFSRYVTQVYRLDDDLLHSLIPNTEKYFVHHPINGGERVLVQIDERGFRRGPDSGPDSGPGSADGPRVAVFGDSCVMAEFSAADRGFPARLGAALGERLETGVMIDNGGVVAYGPDQTCLRMERELPGLSADLVVVVVFADNDFGDLMRNKLFRLDDAGQLVRNPGCRIGEQLREKFSQGLGSTALYRAAQKVYRSIRQSRATEAFEAAGPDAQRAAAIAEVERWIAGCAEEYRDYIVEGDDEVRFLFEDHFDSDVAITPDSESARYKVRLLGAVLGRMATCARANNVPLAVVVLPSPFVLCGSEHGGVVDRDKHPEFDPAAMTTAIRTAAEEHGLPCIDLFDTFASNDPDSLYFLAPDNHWNDAGQQLAAGVVADYLIARGLLP